MHLLCAFVTPLEMDSFLPGAPAQIVPMEGPGVPSSQIQPTEFLRPVATAQFISTEGPGLPSSQMVILRVGVPGGAMQDVRVGAPHMCVLHGESVTLVLGTGQAGSSPVETCSSERVLGRVATVAGRYGDSMPG